MDFDTFLIGKNIYKANKLPERREIHINIKLQQQNEANKSEATTTTTAAATHNFVSFGN